LGAYLREASGHGKGNKRKPWSKQREEKRMRAPVLLSRSARLAGEEEKRPVPVRGTHKRKEKKKEESAGTQNDWVCNSFGRKEEGRSGRPSRREKKRKKRGEEEGGLHAARPKTAFSGEAKF